MIEVMDAQTALIGALCNVDMSNKITPHPINTYNYNWSIKIWKTFWKRIL